MALCILYSNHNYQKLITLPGITFRKLLRLTSMGLLKYLSTQPANLLNGLNLKFEAFHQLILSSQVEFPIDPKSYTKSSVSTVSGGYVVTLRRQYDEYLAKILPLVEDIKLAKLIIREAHMSQFGNVQLGRNFHRSPENTLTHVVVSDTSFYQHKLLRNITKYVRKCMFCNIARPIKAKIEPGTRVAGSMTSDPPYSHVSCDNVHLGYFHPVYNGRSILRYYALVCTCLTYYILQ